MGADSTGASGGGGPSHFGQVTSRKCGGEQMVVGYRQNVNCRGGAMKFEQLYLLSGAYVRGALHVQPVSEIPDHSALFKGTWLPSEPLVFTHHSGGTPRDLITTGFPAIKLVSEQITSILRRERVTGWTSFPVVVTGKDRQAVEGYQGLAVTGRCGPIRKERSQIVRKASLYAGGPPRQVKVGLYFDPTTWTGHDVFSPQGVDYIFVVERVKDILEQAKVKNIDFTRLTDVENQLP